MGVATTHTSKGLGLQTQPKSWPTGWTLWATHYLEFMLSKFSGVNPPDFLLSFKYHFDIIVLSKTHINNLDCYLPDLHDTHVIEGYDKFYVRSTKRHGRVIIYANVNLKATYIDELSTTCNNYDSVKITRTKIPLCVGGYYRHCFEKSTDKLCFIDKIQNHLLDKRLQKSNIILAGDYNIDLRGVQAFQI